MSTPTHRVRANVHTSSPRAGSRRAAFAIALGLLAAACDDGGETPQGPATPPALTDSDGSTAPGTPTSDASVVLPGDTGTGVTPPPVASSDTPWCKVKAVLDQRCTSCHDGAGTGGSPFALKSWEDATKEAPGKPGVKVATRIGVRVHAETATAENLGVMPPGRPIPSEELAAVDAWIAAGTPGGGESCAPTSSTDAGVPAAVWPPAECDGVYKILSHGAGGVAAPYMVQPGAETHPQVTVDAPWGTEKVQAIQFRPITDNKKVLHHWILYSQAGAFLTGWAPGDDERTAMPADVGMEMPTGPGSMRLDLHYFNTTGTQAEPDNSGLEVCVVKGQKLRKNNAGVTMSLMSIGGLGGLAPANTSNYDATGTCVVSASQPIHLLTASPHAHKYARHMKFTLKRKDGSVKVMHDMPFMFGEQGTYPLDPEVIVNSGDTLTTTCTYSNDTNRNITFGESTENEMCFNFALYYPKGGFSCGGGVGGLFGGR